MNWNTSQFDGGLPITLRAAREVSRVLRYVPGTVRDVPQYSFYIWPKRELHSRRKMIVLRLSFIRGSLDPSSSV
jgi:hypothetical protein